MDAQILSAWRAHAEAEFPRESCGLIAEVQGLNAYVPCRNVANNPKEFFQMHPQDFATTEAGGKVLAVCHSHTNRPPTPSKADRAACEATGLPWHIIGIPGAEVFSFLPAGVDTPLLGREFVHGVHDCYSIVRDYYRQELGIALPDFFREDQWWLKGGDLYMENFGKAGFAKVSDLREHDVLLMQLRGSPTVNHAAVYINGDRIVHHLTNRLSRREIYNGYWQRHTVQRIRHNDLANR